MRRIFITTTASLLLTCCTLPAQTSATEYIWCHVAGALTTAYFSEVFAGDRNNTGAIAVAFGNYVRTNYDHADGVAGCLWSREEPSARSDRDQAKAEAKKTFSNVTQTTWHY
jgi:hypothetical protein